MAAHKRERIFTEKIAANAKPMLFVILIVIGCRRLNFNKNLYTDELSGIPRIFYTILMARTARQKPDRINSLIY